MLPNYCCVNTPAAGPKDRPLGRMAHSGEVHLGQVEGTGPTERNVSWVAVGQGIQLLEERLVQRESSGSFVHLGFWNMEVCFGW